VNATNLAAVSDQLTASGTFVYGMMSLSEGYLLVAVVLSSMLVHTLNRKFAHAALWTFLGAVCSFFGVIHSYKVDTGTNTVQAEMVRLLRRYGVCV
jgi:hypothetical protein